MFSGQRPAEVLIADDEPIARDILHFYLENLGCRVHTAEDGDEALAIFRDGADWIGLVVLDALMPGPSPGRLYHLLRQINPTVPILFCSGISPSDPIIREINEQGLRLLSKPFNRGDLHQAILEITKEAEGQVAAAREYRRVFG